MFRLVQALGIAPDMLAGHSYGEFVALFAGGAIDFEALMTLSAARGRFIVDAARAEGAELGTMAAVQAPREAVEAAIADIDGVLIANHNAPAQSIISGSRAGVATASAQLAKAGYDVTEIPVAAAFHSALVKPAQRELAALIDATPWQPVRVPVYSNTTARPHAAEVAKTRKQMAEHLVRPVEFVSEIEAMYQDGARVFLEVGPKAILSRLTAKILAERPHQAISIDEGGGLAGLLGALGQLACAGIAVDLRPLFDRRVLPRRQPGSARVAGDGERLAQACLDAQRQLCAPCRRAAAADRRDARAGQRTASFAANRGASGRAGRGLDRAAGERRHALSPRRHPRPGRGSATTRAMPFTRSSKESRMDQRRSAPGGGDPAVMAEYFETMRQFLETQERVMAAYMTRRRRRHRPRPAATAKRDGSAQVCGGSCGRGSGNARARSERGPPGLRKRCDAAGGRCCACVERQQRREPQRMDQGSARW